MTATLSAVGSVSASRSVRSGRFYCRAEGLRHRAEGLRHRTEGLRHRAEGLRHRTEGLRHTVPSAKTVDFPLLHSLANISVMQ